MSDTPKTDAFISKFYKSRPLSSGSRHRTDVELHDFARQLERELTVLREELKNCSAQFDRQQEQLDRNAEQIATLRQQLAEKKEWVGLTDEEINSIEFPESGTATMKDFVRIIESKLKDKNGG